MRGALFGITRDQEMSKVNYFLVLSFLLTGCASTTGPTSTPEPTASEQDKHDVQMVIFECLMSSTAKMDDFLSSAEVIARAAVSRCSSQLEEAAYVYTKGTSADPQFVLAGIRESSIETATTLVLDNRAKRLQ